MNRKFLVGSLVAVALLLAVIVAMMFWPWDGVDSPPEEVASSQTKTSRPDAVARTEREVEHSSEVDEAAPLPRSASGEALQAVSEESGDGWLRCELPPGLTDLDTRTLKLPVVKDGILYLAVEDSAGTAILRPPLVIPSWADEDLEWNFDDEAETNPEARLNAAERMQADSERIAEMQADIEAMKARMDKPVGFLSWEGAQPGQQGRCTVQATAERVELTVAVVREDGTPFEGASVGSYSFMSSKSHTDASGHATIPGWQGMHMTVYAAEQGYPPFTHQTVVAAAGKTVSFVLEQRSLTEAIGTVIYVLWSEDVPTGLEDLNLLEDALEQPDLSTEAREQIQDWIVDANESVDDTFDLMDLFDEILGLDF